MTDEERRLVEEIARHRTCLAVDDVRWDAVRGCYDGSLLWHGVPTSVAALGAFADFVASDMVAAATASVVVGIASSGIAWATAVALHLGRPLSVLRLVAHKYGPLNLEVSRHAGGNAYLVDNHLGSGETIAAARGLLAGYGISVLQTYVVEARRPDPDVRALLTVEGKIRALLARDYFSSSGAEIARRWLSHRDDWLADEAWVHRIREELARDATNPNGGA